MARVSNLTRTQIHTTFASHLPFLMIDHDIVGLDIPMHDALAVTEIQRLQQLVDVIPHVIVNEPGIQRAEIGVVDVLEHQAGGLALAVAHHVQQGDDVGPA